MSGLIIVFLIWCCIAIPMGWALSKVEQKVNNLPVARTKSAILFSVFLGPLGWIWVVARSSMNFASSINQNQKLQGQAAQQKLHEQQVAQLQRPQQEYGGPTVN